MSKFINLVCPLAPAETKIYVDSVVETRDGHLSTTHTHTHTHGLLKTVHININKHIRNASSHHQICSLVWSQTEALSEAHGRPFHARTPVK